jgi:uncharacterized membrane protein
MIISPLLIHTLYKSLQTQHTQSLFFFILSSLTMLTIGISLLRGSRPTTNYESRLTTTNRQLRSPTD